MAPLVGMRELERLLVMEEWPYRLYIGDALICPERAFLYTFFCVSWSPYLLESQETFPMRSRTLSLTGVDIAQDRR